MNERIQELWRAAAVRDDTVHPWTYDPDMHVEKFAELIVRECAKVCYNPANEIYEARVPMLYEANKRIKEHFGVEE